METVLNHLAIIPDGNRRWAKNHKLLPWQGHIKAADGFIEIIKAAVDLKIKYLTIWAGSYDNLTQRSKREIQILEKIYASFAKKFARDKWINSNQVRVRFLGEWLDLLKPDTVKVLRAVEEETRKYNIYNLTLLIGYNGDREMISAIKRLARRNSDINNDSLKESLWTKDLPPVDLIIRTGHDAHLSAGFMMWDARYAQLYFSDKLWPDFDKKDLLEAVRNLEKRERRFGK